MSSQGSTPPARRRADVAHEPICRKARGAGAWARLLHALISRRRRCGQLGSTATHKQTMPQTHTRMRLRTHALTRACTHTLHNHARTHSQRWASRTGRQGRKLAERLRVQHARLRIAESNVRVRTGPRWSSLMQAYSSELSSALPTRSKASESSTHEM